MIVIISAEGMNNCDNKKGHTDNFNNAEINRIMSDNFIYNNRRPRFDCRNKNRKQLLLTRLKALTINRLVEAMENQNESSDTNESDTLYPNGAQLSEEFSQDKIISKSDSDLNPESENLDESGVAETVSTSIEKSEDSTEEEFFNVMQTRSGKLYKKLKQKDFIENINKKRQTDSDNPASKRLKKDKEINKTQRVDYEGLVMDILYELKKGTFNQIRKRKICKKYKISNSFCIRYANAVSNWLNLSDEDQNIFKKKMQNPKNKTHLILKTVSGKFLYVNVIIDLINGWKISEEIFRKNECYVGLKTHMTNATVWKILIENDNGLLIRKKGRVMNQQEIDDYDTESVTSEDSEYIDESTRTPYPLNDEDKANIVREIIEAENPEKKAIREKYNISKSTYGNFRTYVCYWFDLDQKIREAFAEKIKDPDSSVNIENTIILSNRKKVDTDVLIDFMTHPKWQRKATKPSKGCATSGYHRSLANVWKVLANNKGSVPKWYIPVKNKSIVKCPHSASKFVVRRGQNKGRQRYQCVDCGKSTTSNEL